MVATQDGALSERRSAAARTCEWFRSLYIIQGTLNAVMDRLDQRADARLLVRELRNMLVFLGPAPVGVQSPGVAEAADRWLQSRGTPMVNSWLKHEEDLRAEGRQQGLERGLRQSTILALESKFGEYSRELLPAIDCLHDARQLQAALGAVLKAKGPEDLSRELAALAIG